MDDTRWERLQALFDRAAELSADERDDFLQAECGDDAALRRQVESLLIYDTHDPEATSTDGLARDPVAPPPDRIGPYRLIGELGHGGMGAVFLAERDDETYHKKVAIKLMRGARHPELLRRFKSERQILAALEHPNIARLIDGGATEGGEPYVVMEYVDGREIDRYCEDEGLSTRRRLDLFIEVCAAVQYAHRNLVVHRDIKPGNILVTADGTVKLLDFGIAKMLDPEVAGDERTGTAMNLMTPAYASPEQVRGEPVSTATDVYALGVVLYELLTGARPYRLTGKTSEELRRAIIQQEPRATGISKDLDNIILKALRKEPHLRYASADQLGEDVRAYLAGMPVSARPATRTYRLRKLIGRHPVATAAIVTATVALIAFSITTTIQGRAVARQRDRALEAEKRAEGEAATATATSDFLIRLFQVADPRGEGAKDMTARDLLVRGLQEIEDDESLSPRSRPVMFYTMSLALANLGDFERAVPAMRRCLELEIEYSGEESLRTAEVRHRLGDVLRRSGDRDEAWEHLTAALAIREGQLEGDTYQIADSYNNIAILAVDMCKFGESERLQRASVAMHERRVGPDHQDLGTPLYNLALLMRRLGRRDEAMDIAHRSAGVFAQTDWEDSKLRVRLLEARLTRDLGDPATAIEMIEGLKAEWPPILGENASIVINLDREIAQCLMETGDLAGADSALRAMEPRIREALGTRSISYVSWLLHAGRLDLLQGELASAEERIRSALELHLELTGERHYRVQTLRWNLAEVLIERGKYDEAEALLTAALAHLPDPVEQQHIEAAQCLVLLARVCRETGRPDEAAAHLDAAEPVILATSGPDSAEMEQLKGVKSTLDGDRPT